jgi:hypothetical protein
VRKTFLLSPKNHQQLSSLSLLLCLTWFAGDAITKIADIERSVATRQEQVVSKDAPFRGFFFLSVVAHLKVDMQIRSIQEDLITALNKAQKPEETEVTVTQCAAFFSFFICYFFVQ